MSVRVWDALVRLGVKSMGTKDEKKSHVTIFRRLIYF